MAEVDTRELRNQDGDAAGRKAQRESVAGAPAGKRAAEIRSVSHDAPFAEALVARRRMLPDVDPIAFRRDIDEPIDGAL